MSFTVSLIGYFGYQNLGDEAILKSSIMQLRNQFGNDLKIIVFSEDTETASKYKVTVLKRKSLREILAGIQLSDAVIFAGGTLFQDQTSFANIVYYTSLVFLSKMLKKKVILYSQGIEGFRYRLSKILVKEACVFSDYLSLRDESSFAYVKKNKLKKRFFLTIDSAAHLLPLITIQNSCQQVIGLNLLKGAYKYTEAIISFFKANHLDKKLIFFVFNPSDRQEGEIVLNNLGSARVTICQESDIQKVMGIIAQCDFLIGARLHSLIFAACANTPFVGIAINKKVASFCVEMKQLCFDEDRNFQEKIIQISRDLDRYRNLLKYNFDQYKQRAENNSLSQVVSSIIF